MKLALLLLFPLFLLSCGSQKLLQIGAQTAKDGILVAQKGIDTYTLLGEQADIDVQQQNINNILTVPNAATVPLIVDPPNPLAVEIAPRVNAYKSLISVYQAFGLLTDSKYSADTKTAVTALETSYNSFKKLPGLSSATSSAITAASAGIMQGIQSKAIKKHNQALYALTKIALDLWNEEAPVWNRYLSTVYVTYADQIRKLPAKVYDMTKVQAAEKDDPYTGDAVLLQLYRLNQVAAVIRQKNDLEKALTTFGKELTLLNQAHAELSKDQTGTSNATNSLAAIENLLKPNNNGN